jgi:hypothetical protein
MTTATMAAAPQRQGSQVEPPPRRGLNVHVASAEDIALTYGYDEVVIYARNPSSSRDPLGTEWVTTWGDRPEHKQAAAVIGAALRANVVPMLERLRELLHEAHSHLTRHGTPGQRRALLERITAELAPVSLHSKER